jgi:hypothetical protein
MEVKFRQPVSVIGWCAVYTWANLLNECGVLRLLDDERFKGVGEKEEQEIMDIYLPNHKIKDIAMVNPEFGTVPENLIWNIITYPDQKQVFDEQCIIHILSVRIIEQYWHYIATVTYENEVYYLDPMRKNWLKIEDKNHLADQFIDCSCVSRPTVNGDDKFCSFDAKYFQYPFLKSQLV